MLVNYKCLSITFYYFLYLYFILTFSPCTMSYIIASKLNTEVFVLLKNFLSHEAKLLFSIVADITFSCIKMFYCEIQKIR